MGGDESGGLVGVVGAEDEDAFPLQQEGVQVGDADAFAGEKFNGIGGLAGTVVEFDGEHFAERNGDTGFPEDLVGLVGLGADDAEDAVIDGIGNGGGDELDILLLEEPEDPHQGAGLVFDEDGELLDSHNGSGIQYFFLVSTTRTALPSLLGRVFLGTRRTLGVIRISSRSWRVISRVRDWSLA